MSEPAHGNEKSAAQVIEELRAEVATARDIIQALLDGERPTDDGGNWDDAVRWAKAFLVGRAP